MEYVEIKEVLEKLKKELNLKTDTELAKLFEVKPNTISTWKQRNRLDYERLIYICRNHNIKLDNLFAFDDQESEDTVCYDSYFYATSTR